MPIIEKDDGLYFWRRDHWIKITRWRRFRGWLWEVWKALRQGRRFQVLSGALGMLVLFLILLYVGPPVARFIKHHWLLVVVEMVAALLLTSYIRELCRNIEQLRRELHEAKDWAVLALDTSNGINDRATKEQIEYCINRYRRVLEDR